MTRSVSLAVFCALIVALLSGCVTGGQSSASSSSTAEIRDQLFKLQKDSARILGRLDELDANREGEPSAQVVCAEAVTRIAELQQEVRIIEEQLIATQVRLDEALTQLRALRRLPTRSWAEATAPGAPTPAQAPAESDESGDGTSTATDPTTEAGSELVEAAPEDLFNAAYADYSRGNFDLALAGFDGALRADPEGPLADDAQYWIGETLFAEKRYLDAAAAFERLITGWPEGDKAVRARLKRGIALFEARRTTEAVQILEDLITNWPDSDEARIAQEYFRRKGIVSN